MPRFRVVITDYDYGDTAIERAILEPVGAEVVALQAKSEADLAEAAPDCDAMINQYARVGAPTIALMRRCRVIARYGVGVDIVDVEAATAKGILVTNVRDYCTEEVADHAIALWMTLARKILDYDRATHQSIWHWRTGQPIHRLRGRTAGIVSFGKIGQAIAARAKAFGVELLVYDPFIADEAAAAHERRQSGQGRTARQVRRHLHAGTDDRRHPALSRATRIRHRQARRDRRQHRARSDHRQPGALRCAGVGQGRRRRHSTIRRRNRPSAPHGAPTENPLFSLPNVIVTPHAAYYSEESIRLARETAASEVARVLTGQIAAKSRQQRRPGAEPSPVSRI